MIVPEFGQTSDHVKILVVDDNSVNMSQLMGLLSSFLFSAEVASDGTEAYNP